MLKIWKDNWKGNPAQQSSAQVVDPNLQNAVAAVASSTDRAAAPAGCATTREFALVSDSKDDDLARPAKRKRYSTSNTRDSLSESLPELRDCEPAQATEFLLLPTSDRIDRILKQARHENTIGVLPSEQAIYQLIASFLSWSYRSPRQKPTVVIIEDVQTAKHCSQRLMESCQIPIVVQDTDISNFAAVEAAVLVVPADILLRSLGKRRLTLTDTHAIVVCDAQSFQDQDAQAFIPVVKMMASYYSSHDPNSPRVLVTVHSLNHSFDTSLLALESLFDSTICGISLQQRTHLLAIPNEPKELVVLYNAPTGNLETQLMKDLKRLDPEEATFGRYFRASRHVISEVGPCAADLVWRRSQHEIEQISGLCLRRAGHYIEDSDDADGASDVGGGFAAFKFFNTIKNWSYTMPNLDASSRGFNVTPKFLRLAQVLKACRPYQDNFKGLIFVHKRVVAFAIADIVRSLGEDFSFLRPCVAVGNNFSSPDQSLFRQFSAGTYNLIIATRSLEDLDVPKASLVVRFDFSESHTSQAYVRAKARGAESHIVYMLQRDQNAQRRVLSTITHLDHDMVKWFKKVSTDPRSSTPPDNICEYLDPCHSDDEDNASPSEPFIIDPTTSGRIYLQDATAVIYRFAAVTNAGSGPRDSLFQYEEHTKPDGLQSIVCILSLPPSIGYVRGPPSSTMAQARRAACFHACESLTSAGVLDSRYFQSAPSIRSEAVANNATPLTPITYPHPSEPSQNIKDDLKASGTAQYAQKRPEFWTNSLVGHSDILHPIIVTIGAGDAYAPMIILTRKPLPSLATFRIFSSGSPTAVSLQRAASFAVDQTKLQSLRSYTIRLCRAIGNKPFTCPIDQMTFFFAPLSASVAGTTADSINSCGLPLVEFRVPWDSVALTASTWALPLTLDDDLELSLHNTIIQDRWVEFTRRYVVVALRRDLTPLSKPTDSPREAEYSNILEYCKTRRKGFEGLRNDNQPLVMVERVPPLLNRLSPTTCPPVESTKGSAKYLIPELCARFTVPASTFNTAMALPSIMKRIDELLLVKELNAKLFRHEISEHLLHVALTTPSAGVEYDYERLELLGDAFLKYLSSVYVFVMNPTANEGALHFLRQRLISNKSLLRNAVLSELPAYILSKPFAVRFWTPLNFHWADNSKAKGVGTQPQPTSEIHSRTDVSDIRDIEPGDIAEDRTKTRRKGRRKRQYAEQNTQILGDKAVADVTEAIIGAAYVSGGREVALRAAKALNIPTPDIDCWSDFGRKALAPHPGATARLRPGSVEAVEAIIGHTFQRPHLLAQALTHGSMNGHETTSYERFEFIGDAILDFMVIRHIFDRNQLLTPGGLTLLKGAMVSNSALAAVCVRSGLHKHILFESKHLSATITTYINQLNARQAEEHNVAASERRLPGQYWLELDPPKALSDVVESVIGAIYISDNFSPKGVETFFDNVLKPFFDKHVSLRTLSHHPTKTLLEMFQAQGCQQFEVVREKRRDAKLAHCSVLVHNIILADAQDETASVAARCASIAALDALEGDPTFLLRTCDCRGNATDKKQKTLALDEVLARIVEDMSDD